MSISKTLKSVVKYQSQSWHNGKYLRKTQQKLQLLPKPVKTIQVLPENIKQPFWKEERRSLLPKDILGVRLSNFNVKDLSQRINSLKVNLNNVMMGNASHLLNPKMKEVLVINSKGEKLLKKVLLWEHHMRGKDIFLIFLNTLRKMGHINDTKLEKIKYLCRRTSFKNGIG